MTVPADFLWQAVAHSADTVVYNINHAERHLIGVRNAADQAGRAYNLDHLADHSAAAHESEAETVRSVLPAWNPGVRAALTELDGLTSLTGRAAGPGLLTACKPGACLCRPGVRAAIPPVDDSVPPDARPATVAHLAGTVLVALGHVRAHADAARAAVTAPARDFHLDHAERHLVRDAEEHQRKYASALHNWFGDVGAELDTLDAVAGLFSRAPADTGRSFAGLADFRLHDRCDLCSDPKVPGRACDNPLCPASAETDRGRAQAKLAAELAAAAGGAWEGPVS